MKPLKAPSRPLPLLDSTGIKVPREIVKLWNRHGDILELLHCVKAIAYNVGEAPAGDMLYSAIDRKAIKAITKQLEAELKLALPYAVCPTCNGVNATADCICKGRGYLSEHIWKTCVPEETKRITGRTK